MKRALEQEAQLPSDAERLAAMLETPIEEVASPEVQALLAQRMGSYLHALETKCPDEETFMPCWARCCATRLFWDVGARCSRPLAKRDTTTPGSLALRCAFGPLCF